MEKKFAHAVIYNGKYYPANTPVPMEDEKPEAQAEAPEPEKVENDAEQKAQAEAPEPEKVTKNGRKRTGRKPKS